MKIARMFSSQILNRASRYAKQQIENPSENPNEKILRLSLRTLYAFMHASWHLKRWWIWHGPISLQTKNLQR